MTFLCYQIILAAVYLQRLESSGFSCSRSSDHGCYTKTDALKKYTKFTGKHLCQSLLHGWFSVNFVTFLRTSFLQNTFGRLTAFIMLLSIWFTFDCNIFQIITEIFIQFIYLFCITNAFIEEKILFGCSWNILDHKLILLLLWDTFLLFTSHPLLILML